MGDFVTIGPNALIYRRGSSPPFGGQVNSAVLLRPNITGAGSIDDPDLIIGQLRTADAGIAEAVNGGVISYEIEFLANGVVRNSAIGAQLQYTYLAADDTLPGLVRWRAIETGGGNPSPVATTWQVLVDATITRDIPVIGLNPTEDNILEGTLAGSVLAAITMSGGEATPTLSGANAAMFGITGSYPNFSLTLAQDANTVGEFDVTIEADNSNPADPVTATFDLTVNEDIELTVEGGSETLSITFPSGDGSPTDAAVLTFDSVSYTQERFNDVVMTRGFLEATNEICLTKPEATQLDEDLEPGSRIEFSVPLIFYQGADPGDPTVQILRNGVPISGATNYVYTIQEVDRDDDLTCRVSYVGNQVDSDPVSIPAGPPLLMTPVFLDIARQNEADVGSPIISVHTCTLDLSAHDSSKPIFVAIGAIASDVDVDLVSGTLNGVASTAVFSQTISPSNGEIASGYLVFPAGDYPDTAVCEITHSDNLLNVGAAAYEIPAGTVLTVINNNPYPGANRTVTDVSGTFADGSGIIAIATTANTFSAISWSGDATEDAEVDFRSQEWLSVASAGNVSAGAKTLLASHDNNRSCGLSVQLTEAV